MYMNTNISRWSCVFLLRQATCRRRAATTSSATRGERRKGRCFTRVAANTSATVTRRAMLSASTSVYRSRRTRVSCCPSSTRTWWVLPPTYSYFVPPVTRRALGDDKSPSVSVAGEPAGSMPADTHLFQVFLECTPPCLLRLPPSFLPSSGTQYIAVWAGLSLCIPRTWPAIFLLKATMSWESSMPAVLITSSFVALSHHEMPRIVCRHQSGRHRRWILSLGLYVIMAVLFHVLHL